MKILRREILMDKDDDHVQRPSRAISEVRCFGSADGLLKARAANSRLRVLRRNTISAKPASFRYWRKRVGVKPQWWAIAVLPRAIAVPNPHTISWLVTGPAGDW